jgi:hypothetical protein
VAWRSQKPHGHGLAIVVVLHSDNGSLGDERAIDFFQAHVIVKLERESGSEECFTRSGKLDHSGLHKPSRTQVRRQDFNLNAHRASAREKLRELIYTAFRVDICSYARFAWHDKTVLSGCFGVGRSSAAQKQTAIPVPRHDAKDTPAVLHPGDAISR